LIVEASAEKLEHLRNLRKLVADLPEPPALPLEEWVTDTLGEHFWSKQREIAQTLRDNRRVAVKSCHGVGKSFLASRAIAHWLATHPPGEAFVVSTAPTFAQVRAVLWREINKAHAKGNLPGTVNQTEWHLNGELVGFGRKPADTDPSAFQGIHAKYVLVVLDEACGIPKDLWIAAGALTTNAECRILAIGNPDDPGSHFATVCKPGSGWKVVQISAFDSPNFTAEEIPPELAPLLVSPEWVDDMKKDVGEGSGPWIAKVLGDFPQDADWQVVSGSGLARCRVPDQPVGDDLTVELGMDVGAGGDMTVIVERVGRRLGRIWRESTPKPEQAVALALMAIRESGATAIKIDSIGVGWGVAGRLDELRGTEHNAHVHKVNVSHAPKDKKRFPKLRDELWWTARTNTERGLWDLSTADDKLIAQLSSPMYGTDSSGRIKVEPKAETRKRLGRSPDDADALLLAFCMPNGVASVWADAWHTLAKYKGPTSVAEPPGELRFKAAATASTSESE